MIVFTAILSFFIFGHIPHWRESSGIFLVVFGIILVGLADYLDTQETHKDTMSVILGDSMSVVGSFLASCQVVMEEKYLKKYDIPPLQAAGYEGGDIFQSPFHLNTTYYFHFRFVRFYHNDFRIDNLLLHSCWISYGQ